MTYFFVGKRPEVRIVFPLLYIQVNNKHSLGESWWDIGN